MRVDIRLLGAFEVVVAGQRVPDEAWRRRQSAALVKLLALSRGHRLLREQVMDALWPESPVGQAAPRLHKAAHYARTALGVRDSVVLSDDTVSLFPLADVVVDADQFDDAADAARATGESTLAAAGVDLYRGDLLPDDLYEPWAEETRERLRLRYLDLLRALGRWDKVVVSDPADEQAHLRLAQEHMHRGDRRAALLQLDRMETVLRRELGVGPSEPAIALRDEVLAMPAEDWQPRAASRTPIPMPQTQTIGRDRDVAIVMQMLARSRVVTLLGPGGVGKTRPRGEPRFVLLELLRDRARDLLAGGEASSIADRHSAYVAALLDDLEERHWTDAADRWIDVITESLAEIRAAHAWAEQRGDAYLAARITAGLGSYWHREGHHTEGRRWVTEAMAHQADFDDCLIARLHLAAGFVERPRDQSVARRHWTESAHRFRVLGSERYLAYSLAMASASYVGDRATHDFAIRLCDEAIGLARNVGEQPLIAQALNVKGELARVHGDDALALTAYAEGRELAAAAHDEAHLGMFLGNLSFLADHRGDHEEARRLARDGLRTSWSLGRLMKSAWAISGLAGPELGLGRPERAALLVGAADRALHTLDVALDPCDLPEHKRVLTGLQSALGEATLDLLRFKGAQLSLDEAVALALSDDDETGWPFADSGNEALSAEHGSGQRAAG